MAQWSNDPSVNTLIYQGGIHGPKIVTVDNFYYISYFRVTPNGHIPFLQKVNLNGFAEWPYDGLLINDRNQPSIYRQYDIKVDNDNNAVLAFRNEEAYTDNFYLSVYEISSEGEFLWGEDGKRFDLSGYKEVAPLLTINRDNSVTVMAQAYKKDSLQGYFNIGVNKYSSSGENLWEEYSIVGSDSLNIVPIGMVSSQDGGLIILFRIYDVIYPYSYSDIYVITRF